MWSQTLQFSSTWKLLRTAEHHFPPYSPILFI
jgi:hypothetical protein